MDPEHILNSTIVYQLTAILQYVIDAILEFGKNFELVMCYSPHRKANLSTIFILNAVRDVFWAYCQFVISY